MFLTSYYGNGSSHSVELPCNTLTTKPRFAYQYINYDYSKLTTSSIDSAAGTITVKPKHNIITSQFTFDTQFNNASRSILRPAQTLIAKMDKKPIYFISAANQSHIDRRLDQPGDSEIIRKIRKFMREHHISDVKIRMLHIHELGKIQGFPPSFKFHGTKTNIYKFIGNSVAPIMAQKLAETNELALIKHFKTKSLAA